MQLIYGYQSVSEILKNPKRKTFNLFITQKKLQELQLNINNVHISNYQKIIFKSHQELNYLCKSENHNGIAIQIEDFFFSIPVDSLKSHIIILVNITDTGNLGAIIRSAAIFQYDIIFSRNNTAPINSQVCKNAAGGLEYTNIHVCGNLLQVIKYLKRKYYFIVGATEKYDTSINLQNLPDKLCLIMGGENTGIPQGILKELDFIYNIPGYKFFNTFNVSVAAALSMQALKPNILS
jgi:23S rRNA (guanosine2251-2'-O)-methyltransferase